MLQNITSFFWVLLNMSTMALYRGDWDWGLVQGPVQITLRLVRLHIYTNLLISAEFADIQKILNTGSISVTSVNVPAI